MNDLDEKDLLVRELRDRCADIGGHPIASDSVRARARKIQRRRHVITGTIAAVVLAVAVPTALSVTEGVDGTQNGPVDRPSPSVTESAAPRPQAPVTLTINGLPRGEDPQLSYVLHKQRTLVTPDGSVALPEPYSQITPYRDGWLALYGGQNGYENVILDSDMNVLGRTPGGVGLVTNADGTRVLYSQRDFNVPGRTVVIDAPSESDYEREAMSWDAPRRSWVEPIGYLDEQTIVFQTENPENPAITMASHDEGGVTVPLEGFLHVNAASEANGLVSGMTSYGKKVCHAVMRPAESTTEMVWETCDYSLGQFSPDGRFVIAGTPEHDGFGSPTLAILDVETGDPVVEFEPPSGQVMVAVAQATWEDADSVLAAVIEGNEVAMVRAELSGELEVVTDTFEFNMNYPFWFADRPRS